ncbi:MAG: hypothetical protein ACRDY1_01000 [Acidimicrobiales bacterium]
MAIATEEGTYLNPLSVAGPDSRHVWVVGLSYPSNQAGVAAAGTIVVEKSGDTGVNWQIVDESPLS